MAVYGCGLLACDCELLAVSVESANVSWGLAAPIFRADVDRYFVSVYQTAQHHTREDLHSDIYCFVSIKFYGKLHLKLRKITSSGVSRCVLETRSYGRFGGS